MCVSMFGSSIWIILYLSSLWWRSTSHLLHHLITLDKEIQIIFLHSSSQKTLPSPRIVNIVKRNSVFDVTFKWRRGQSSAFILRGDSKHLSKKKSWRRIRRGKIFHWNYTRFGWEEVSKLLILFQFRFSRYRAFCSNYLLDCSSINREANEDVDLKITLKTKFRFSHSKCCCYIFNVEDATSIIQFIYLFIY